MIHAVLSVVHVATDLSEEDRRAVSRAGICYHVMNVRGGRTLVSVTLPDELLIDQFIDYFDAKGRQCKLICDHYKGGHRPGQTIVIDEETGEKNVIGIPTRAFDDAEMLERLPDKDDVGGRYSAAFQFVKPFGWDDWI